MSLETKSQQLKDLFSTYNADWLLGDLSALIHAGRERANDQLGKLSSPQRQLYYLAGLNISSDPDQGLDVMFTHEKWNPIVALLNEIEADYNKLFFPTRPEEVTDEWKRVRQVAMPSFLSYFNQGPLNYEEQCTSPLNGWTKLVNQFSHLNLGYGKTTQKLFCGTEASNHPGSGTKWDYSNPS